LTGSKAPILLMTEVFPPQIGGSGRWLWELHRRLPVDVKVIAGTYAGAAEFDRTHHLPIERLPLSFSNWGLLTPRSFKEYVHTFRRVSAVIRNTLPRAIVTGKALPEGLIARACAARFRLPYASYVHGEELTLATTSRELRALTKHVLRHARLLVANSDNTRDILTGQWNVPANRVRVLHPGVDTTRFVPSPRDENVRQRLGWSGRRVVLTVGALQRRKGQDMMIRALPEIAKRCPEVLYAVAGAGPDGQALRDLAGELGVAERVQFVGPVADRDLIECYQQCDLFALPNRQVGWDFEGFGIVLIEAQACGVPVIAGRSGGTAETLSPGISGELVACETPGPLGQVVSALLADDERRARMGRAGRDWASAHYSWPVLTTQATEIFEALGA
jgi:phosphatidyl-myo-inositol dimannoside synthase